MARKDNEKEKIKKVIEWLDLGLISKRDLGIRPFDSAIFQYLKVQAFLNDFYEVEN